MRSTLLIVALTIIVAPVNAQFTSAGKDDLPPEAYAAWQTKRYTEFLNLTPEQNRQTYATILQKRKTQDSVKANLLHLDGSQLWALTTSLDTKYRQILTHRQYIAYEELQKIFYVEAKKIISGDLDIPR